MRKLKTGILVVWMIVGLAAFALFGCVQAGGPTPFELGPVTPAPAGCQQGVDC